MSSSTRASLAHLGLDGVVQPGGFEAAQELVGAAEQHRVSAADRDVPQRGSQVRLADPHGPQDERAAALVEQSQGAQLVPGLPVEAGAAVAVEGLQAHARVELGGAGAQLGGGPVAAFDLVGQQQAQEVGVRQLLGPGEGEAFGQGVEQSAELDPAQQALELGVDAGSLRRCGAHRRSPAANSAASRTNRDAPPTTLAGWAGRARSRACSSIRAILVTSTTSSSSARAHAASTGSGP
jgi:hypothetical protein